MATIASIPSGAAYAVPPPPSLDFGLNPISGQQAWAILDLQGRVLSSSMSNNNNINEDQTLPLLQQQDVDILYEMMIAAAPITAAQGPLSRMTISFESNDSKHVQYILTRDATHIYIVQAKA
jgi:hypothetical protein